MERYGSQIAPAPMPPRYSDVAGAAEPCAVPGTFEALLQRATAHARHTASMEQWLSDLEASLIGHRPPPPNAPSNASVKEVPAGFIERMNEVFDLAETMMMKMNGTLERLREKV